MGKSPPGPVDQDDRLDSDVSPNVAESPRVSEGKPARSASLRLSAEEPRSGAKKMLPDEEPIAAPKILPPPPSQPPPMRVIQFLSSPSASSGSGPTHGENHGDAPAPFSPRSAGFRLRPRGGISVTPSPISRGGTRGRKRGARCLATQEDLDLNGDFSSVAAASDIKASPSPSSSTPTKEIHPGPFPSSNIAGGLMASMESPATPHFESAMQSLSIMSPRAYKPTTPSSVTRSPMSIRTPSSSYRSIGSSFIAYKSSPSDPNALKNHPGSMPSPSPRFIKSSQSGSSPRFTPLKVIQKDQERVMGTPKNRPPLHRKLPFSFSSGNDGPAMFSGSKVPHLSRAEKPADAMLPSESSLSVQATAAKSPPASRYEDHSTIGTPSSRVLPMSFSSPINQSPFSSPRVLRHPGASPQLSRASPRTPLPRARLTPRSAQSNRVVPFLSTSASSPSADIFADRPSFVQQQPRIPSRENPFLPARAATTKPDGDRASLPMWNNSLRARAESWPLESPGGTRIQRSEFILPSSLKTDLTPKRDEITCAELVGGFLGVKAKSLLTPSRSGGMLEQMVREEAEAAAMDADGSLSDDDDESNFILASPAAIVEERNSQNQSRQRRRCSYESHRTSSSLDETGGMDASNGSLNYFANQESAQGIVDVPIPRQGSDDDLDLPMVAASAGNRDLVTPPTVSNLSSSPPPLSGATYSNTSTVAFTFPSNVTVSTPVRRTSQYVSSSHFICSGTPTNGQSIQSVSNGMSPGMSISG